MTGNDTGGAPPQSMYGRMLASRTADQGPLKSISPSLGGAGGVPSIQPSSSAGSSTISPGRSAGGGKPSHAVSSSIASLSGGTGSPAAARGASNSGMAVSKTT